MNPQELFVTRLRRHRERHRISIDTIATEMRVKPELLTGLENNDLSEWPRGLYARAWIRAYATAVGLDPVDTVDEFCRLFPHGDRRAASTIHEIAAIVAEPCEYRDEFDHKEDRRRTGAPDVNTVPRTAWHAPIVQGARTLWIRVSSMMAPYVRDRRTPRPAGGR